MNLLPHIEKFRARFAELETALSDPKVFDNQQRAQELSREYSRLKELLAIGDSYKKALADLEENRALLKTELPDSEMAQMAKEEIARLEADEKKLAQQIQFGIIPPNPTDSRNTIVEIRAGAGGMHLEDQVSAKRCGHRPGKALVPPGEMVDRIKAAVDARTDPGFVVMARTDALAVEGLEAALERAHAYVTAGADMIFAEAVKTLDEYRQFVARVGVPVLANITEFGQTPLFTLTELGDAGVRLVLYPLSAFRAAAKAEVTVFAAIRREGTQKSVVPTMQTRAELYEVLGYYEYERKLDELFGKTP